MSTLYLDRQDMEVSLEGRHLRLRVPPGGSSTVPLAAFQRLIVLGKVGLDSSVLGAMAEAGIAVTLIGGRSLRRRALLLGAGGQDASRRLDQYRASTNPQARVSIARVLLQGKVMAQAQGVAEMLATRPDQRLSLCKRHASIQRVAQSLDTTEAAGLLGLEGAAARAWYVALAAVLPENLEFSGRNRRPPRDPFNSVLSLAYTLIHADAVAIAWSVGLDPMIGFLHEPLHGRESLACDLIEPLRPRIDLALWRVMAERQLQPEHFSTGPNGCYLTKTGRSHFYPLWETVAPPWRRYLRRLSHGLVRHLGEHEAPTV